MNNVACVWIPPKYKRWGKSIRIHWAKTTSSQSMQKSISFERFQNCLHKKKKNKQTKSCAWNTITKAGEGSCQSFCLSLFNILLFLFLAGELKDNWIEFKKNGLGSKIKNYCWLMRRKGIFNFFFVFFKMLAWSCQ